MPIILLEEEEEEEEEEENKGWLNWLEELNKSLNIRHRTYRDSVYHAYRNIYELDKKEIELENRNNQIEMYEFKQQMLVVVLIIGALLIALYVNIKRKAIANERRVNTFQKQFVENVTHEINTPLTLINGVLENTLLSGEVNKELVNIGVKNVNQLKADMERILYFMKDSLVESNRYKEKVYLLSFFYDLIEDFLENIESLKIESAVRKLNKPLLVIHGKQDETVPVNHATRIAEWSGADATLLLIEECNHTFQGMHPWTEKNLPDSTQKAIEATVQHILN